MTTISGFRVRPAGARHAAAEAAAQRIRHAVAVADASVHRGTP
ncbi:MAG TPA: hypothetical protein VFR27_02345 [Mycobacterium sp.]|jgi:hypothetical protein|nr:hypothetical protein [Mycobacterium sp.]